MNKSKANRYRVERDDQYIEIFDVQESRSVADLDVKDGPLAHKIVELLNNDYSNNQAR